MIRRRIIGGGKDERKTLESVLFFSQFFGSSSV
jgi:hypothetical protein